MKIVGVGFSCIDVYEKLNKYYPTGNSVDFAIHMSRFSLQTSVVSVVGNDKYGKLMKEALTREGVGISHLHTEEGSTSIMKMELDDNDRVHGEEIEGVMAAFTLTDEDIEFIKQHDMMHTDLFGKILDLLPVFKESGICIVLDFSVFLNDEKVEKVLQNVDYAFFSYKQQDEYILEYLKWAKSLGPKVVTATLGENGSLSYDGVTLYKEGIVPVEIVNTVGAGDSFIAGFMYGVSKNESIQECMRHGAISASKVIMNFEPY